MMIITNEYGQRVLMPDDLDTQYLVPVVDIDLPEEDRNYYEMVYLANCISFESCQKMYMQVEKPKDKRVD